MLLAAATYCPCPWCSIVRRNQSADSGNISQFAETGMVVDRVEVQLLSRCYEDGRVSWRLCGDSECVIMRPGKPSLWLCVAHGIKSIRDVHYNSACKNHQHPIIFVLLWRSHNNCPLSVQVVTFCVVWANSGVNVMFQVASDKCWKACEEKRHWRLKANSAAVKATLHGSTRSSFDKARATQTPTH